MQHKKQEYIQAIEAFIDDYRDKIGVIPTMPEIAAGVGLSTATICKYIGIFVFISNFTTPLRPSLHSYYNSTVFFRACQQLNALKI